MIKFPVLTRLTVKGYELYPGQNGDEGLNAAFRPGVSVVVGINGLGKTTLLTLMLRLLLGADDWQVPDDQEEIGNKKHEISPWRGRGYFKERVRDGACNATAEADVFIGEAKVTITRSLDSLSILSLIVNDSPLEPSQEKYRQTIESLAGASFYDFILLLRYVVFFMEDRRSALWDENAQDEILRLLFYPAPEAKELAELSDSIQSENSNFRNIRPYYNNQRKRLESLRARAANATAHSQVEAFRQQRDALQARWRDLHAGCQKVEEDWEGVRQSLEQEKIASEETRLDYERERQNYFANVFPRHYVADTPKPNPPLLILFQFTEWPEEPGGFCKLEAIRPFDRFCTRAFFTVFLTNDDIALVTQDDDFRLDNRADNGCI